MIRETYEKPTIELIEFTVEESIALSGPSALGPSLICSGELIDG